MVKKKQSYWLYILSFITTIGVILGIITDGFQVWDSVAKEKKNVNPSMIDFKIESFKLNVGDDYSKHKNVQVEFSIQSVNGVYKILDSIKVDQLVIIDSSFFDFTFEPKILIKEIHLEKRILGSKNPDQKGYIRFENDYVLKGDAVGDIIRYDSEKTIAKFIVSIPYLYNEEIITSKCEVPITLYYKS